MYKGIHIYPPTWFPNVIYVRTFQSYNITFNGHPPFNLAFFQVQLQEFSFHFCRQNLCFENLMGDREKAAVRTEKVSITRIWADVGGYEMNDQTDAVVSSVVFFFFFVCFC